MSHRPRLLPVQPDRLAAFRRRAEDAGGDPAVIGDLARDAAPEPSATDLTALEHGLAAGVPIGNLAGVALRVDPVRFAGDVAATIAASPHLLDDLLIDLAAAGPETRLEAPIDLFVAYWSRSWRWAYLGMDDPPAVWDGPPGLDRAIADWTPETPPALHLLGEADVVRVAADLGDPAAAVPRSLGEFRHLYDFCDDHVLPGYPLDRVCRDGFSQLRALYAAAATAGHAVRVTT